MSGTITLRDFHLYSVYEREMFEGFLTRHGLRFERDMEYAVGAYDERNSLLACGACAGAVLKGFAVSEEARGRNLLGTILSHLVARQFRFGISHLWIFTKPHNKPFFLQSGFNLIEETEHVSLLENSNNGLEQFARECLSQGDRGVISGAVVMNCNPFTLGHRFLIEKAAKSCGLLHIFLVEEDRSDFPFAVRRRLVQEGTADLPNVRIHGSGPYIISSATFPAYFFKESDPVAEIGAELDLRLFSQKIGPLFFIRRRFVGDEPYCTVTQKYNEAMRQMLPAYGIEVSVIPRFQVDGSAVSASQVRRTLREDGVSPSVQKLVPESTWKYLNDREGRALVEKMRQAGELYPIVHDNSCVADTYAPFSARLCR